MGSTLCTVLYTVYLEPKCTTAAVGRPGRAVHALPGPRPPVRCSQPRKPFRQPDSQQTKIRRHFILFLY